MTQIKDIYGNILFEVEGEDLRYVDFRGKDLRNANFREVNLYHALFRDADIEGADFSGAKVLGTILTKRYLKHKGAKFDRMTKFDEEERTHFGFM